MDDQAATLLAHSKGSAHSQFKMGGSTLWLRSVPTSERIIPRDPLSVLCTTVLAELTAYDGARLLHREGLIKAASPARHFLCSWSDPVKKETDVQTCYQIGTREKSLSLGRVGPLSRLRIFEQGANIASVRNSLLSEPRPNC